MVFSKNQMIFFVLFIGFILYSYFVYTSGTEQKKNAVADSSVVKGKLLFQEYNCTSCHQLYGLGGYMGPDLTNVISSKGKGEQYAAVFIQNGTQKMPNFNLSREQVDELVAYLKYVDQTGFSPAREYTINKDASVNFKEE